MQQFIETHMDAILMSWWIVFWGVFALLITRFFIYAPLKFKTYQFGDEKIIADYTKTKPSKNLFFMSEIHQDVMLRLFGGAILLGFLTTFAGWQMNQATTIQGVEQGVSVCWPFFQDCFGLIFLETLPNGYSQTILYMGLFTLIFISFWGN